MRYIWNFCASIDVLRRVVTAAPEGRTRREAAIDLAEVLLIAASNFQKVEFDDGTVASSSSLAAEARSLLDAHFGFRHLAREFAVFRDRADLEVGVTINWEVIDEAFETVVGDVDAYSSTIAANVSMLRSREDSAPEHLADLVLVDFTSASVLRGLGCLYLRRAELGLTADPTEACRRAYAAFKSCRVLEMAFSGGRSESATTSYQRARAIVAAVRATGKTTPFACDLERKESLIHLASALFSRAVGLSVGLFHVEARARQSEAARLQKSLG
jgi:hypothetical protein